jgi:xylan 1,4-beta-xylosidase
MIRNPILPGFNPDPAIMRVGADYYIATSTLVWQPGIRLFHSTNLATWTLVGHALTEHAHELRGVAPNEGVWAPCLTFDPRAQLFYLAYGVVHSTNAELFDVDNYVVTAPAVTGPWTRPTYLNSVGFDPCFFHDDDGRHWFLALEWDPRDGYEHPGAILLDEYDADSRSLIGPSTRIYRGATNRGCLEGPHLYKHNGFYYLMTAEGGTGFGHSATLARSGDIAGPYQPAPNNPFLTSNPAPYFGRNDRDYLRPHLFNPHAELQKAGHGSLVDTPDGEWYVAHLCARPLPPHRRSVLGRETALQKVEWAPEGWLRLTTGDPVARLSTPLPSGAYESTAQASPERVHDDFDGPTIDKRFSTLRTPLATDWARFDTRPGSLTLRGREALTSLFDVSLVATQLQDFQATVETRVDFAPTHYSQSAGLVLFYDNRYFAFLRVYRSESLGSMAVGIVLVENGQKRELLLDRAAVPDGDVVLHARIDTGVLQFFCGRPDEPLAPIGPTLDATMMSDETTRGFTGTMVGIACQDGYRRDAVAHFAYFDLQHGGQALSRFSG